MPVTGSSPIVASQRPRPPASRPFTSASPLSEATNLMQIRASMKNTGEPCVSTSGRTIGIASPSTSAPNTAPTSELIIAAPSARPASPFFAIAWPSTIVAAVVGSPGIPNRIDVMSPVVAVTASMPSRKANASIGVILNTQGSMRASVATHERVTAAERILRAAVALFRERGYHGSSMRTLARALRMEAASLYYHFKSKQEILFAILDRTLDDLLAGVGRAVASADGPE